MILYVWPKYETMLRGLGKQTAIRSLRAHIGERPPLEVMKPWHLEKPQKSLWWRQRDPIFLTCSSIKLFKGSDRDTNGSVNYSAVWGRSRKRGSLAGRLSWSCLNRQAETGCVDSGPIVFLCTSNVYISKNPCYDTSEVLAYSIIMYHRFGYICSLFPELRSLGCVCWLFLATVMRRS